MARSLKKNQEDKLEAGQLDNSDYGKREIHEYYRKLE
jgi:hypothetical protein